MVGTIDDFRARLTGGGARANQFSVRIVDPPAGGVAFPTETGAFLAKGTSLPAMSIEEIEIPFRGRTIRIAGDRDFADPWTVTFINDTDFALRTQLEIWSNSINDLATGSGLTRTLDYVADLSVSQLDRDNTVLKTYKFVNAWPQAIGEIALASESANEIEEFEVTWRYQHFVTTGVGSGVADIPAIF